MTDIIRLKIPINSAKELLEKVEEVLRNMLPDVELEVEYIKSRKLSLIYENDSIKQLISFNDPKSVDYRLIARNLGLARYFALTEKRKVVIRKLK